MTKKTEKPNGAESIDENLRRVYEQVLNEDVPDRFKDLLDRLKSQDDPSEGDAR